MSVGIDFGTSKVCVAVYRHKTVEVIPNEGDSRLTPCYIGFNNDEIQIGETAKNKASMNMENTVYQMKRFIGRAPDDPYVKKNQEAWGFNINESVNARLIKVVFCSEEKVFCAEEISSIIIKKMKEMAENHLRAPVNHATISVPACFNDAQRCAVKNAGLIAGFANITLINETTAAAIAYNSNIGVRNRAQRILVFDLGAGTFDVSICELKDNDIRVVASHGNPNLGGEDFDLKVTEYFVKEFETQHRKSISDNKKAKLRLRIQCEHAKKLLSIAASASVQVDCLFEDIDFRSSITRKQFESLNKEYFDIIRCTVIDTIKEANIRSSMIDQVVLVGGSTRITKIRNILIEIFGEKKLNRTINADEAVAIGAAIRAEQGNVINSPPRSRTPVVKEVISRALTVGDGKNGDLLIIQKNCPIPSIVKQILANDSDYKIYEIDKNGKNLIGDFKFPDFSSHINFGVDENGILAIDTRGGSVEARFSGDRLNSEVTKYMKIKMNDMGLENQKSQDKNRARNDLEKLMRSTKKSLKANEKITPEQKKILSDKCDAILRMIKDNKSATIEDYQKAEAQISELIQQSSRYETKPSENECIHGNQTATVETKSDRQNAKPNKNVISDLDKEEQRNVVRFEYFWYIRKIREEAMKSGRNEFVRNDCTESERWLEDHMKENREVYKSKLDELKNRWERIENPTLYKYQYPPVPPVQSAVHSPRKRESMNERYGYPKAQTIKNPSFQKTAQTFNGSTVHGGQNNSSVTYHSISPTPSLVREDGYESRARRQFPQIETEKKKQDCSTRLEQYKQYILSLPVYFKSDERRKLKKFFRDTKTSVKQNPHCLNQAIADLQERCNTIVYGKNIGLLQYHQMYQK